MPTYYKFVKVVNGHFKSATVQFKSLEKIYRLNHITQGPVFAYSNLNQARLDWLYYSSDLNNCCTMMNLVKILKETKEDAIKQFLHIYEQAQLEYAVLIGEGKKRNVPKNFPDIYPNFGPSSWSAANIKRWWKKKLPKNHELPMRSFSTNEVILSSFTPRKVIWSFEEII